MKHQIVAVDLTAPHRALDEVKETGSHCIWCSAAGQWREDSHLLLEAFLKEQNDLELLLRRWAQPVIRIADESNMSEEHISSINDLIVQIEWIIEDPVHDTEPYIRDQFFAFVQLITSLTLTSLTENELKRPARWVDIRDIFEGTDEYGAASLKNLDRSLARLEEERGENEILFLAWNLASTSMNDSVSFSPKTLEAIAEHLDVSTAIESMR